MKKIVLSLSLIALVAVVAVGATRAFFSDTETSTGNIISAGTIGISVDDQASWSANYTADLNDMKPGMTRYITFVVKNTGTNPLVLRKQLGSFVLGSELSETDCISLGGLWSGTTCTSSDGKNLSNVMTYDMDVNNGSATTTLISSSWGIKMSDVEDLWVPLGTVQPQGTLTVTQSYHFDEATTNWAQGDTLTFDISLHAEQLGGPGPNTTSGVVLENKDTSTWDVVIDGTWGLVTWDGSDYRVRGFGMNAAKSYVLTYWDGSTENPIGSVVPATGGEVDFSGSYAGFGTNTDAKYWLRPSPWSSSSDVDTLYEGNVVKQTP